MRSNCPALVKHVTDPRIHTGAIENKYPNLLAVVFHNKTIEKGILKKINNIKSRRMFTYVIFLVRIQINKQINPNKNIGAE